MRRNETGAKLLNALGSGLAGAATLNVIHEAVRRVRPQDAPRMDTLGRRSIARAMRLAGARPPARDKLQALALVGDIVSNTLFYTLVGAGSPNPRRALLRGAVLGSAAGVGAVMLPPLMGLGSAPSRRTPQTKAMTFAWYLAGGLAAAGVWTLVNARLDKDSE